MALVFRRTLGYVTFAVARAVRLSVCRPSVVYDVVAPSGLNFSAIFFAPSNSSGTRTVCIKILEFEGVVGDRAR